MNKYRIYIDEVGNHDLKNVDNPNQRYLSLTGVIFELDYVARELFPRLEQLKSRYFRSHPDEPIIFHRKELVNKKQPFIALKNAEISTAFDTDLLTLLNDLDYIVLTVVLDKKEHKEHYTIWHFDPYHYCMRVLVERFVLFLEKIEAVGDIMCESRGKKEDMRLKKSFKKIYTEGTEYIPPKKFETFLTSCELKVKPKSNNIAGLQIADLIAHPSYKRILKQKGRIDEEGDFGKKISIILDRDKYYRSSNNKLWALGKSGYPK